MKVGGGGLQHTHIHIYKQTYTRKKEKKDPIFTNFIYSFHDNLHIFQFYLVMNIHIHPSVSIVRIHPLHIHYFLLTSWRSPR